MLSNEMYLVLSCFPRKLGKPISFKQLVSSCILEKDDIIDCLNETIYDSWNYIRSSNGWKEDSLLYLTESGLSEMEEYEHAKTIQKVTRDTLKISIIALVISFVSVIVAILSKLL